MHPSPLVTPDAKRPPFQLVKLWTRCLNREISNSDRGGWIYVFYEGGLLGGLFKIGRTNDLARRISEWTVACPGKWRTWLGAFWTPFATRTAQIRMCLQAAIVMQLVLIPLGGVRHMEKFAFSGDQRTVYDQFITSAIVKVIALVKAYY
ncbi:hypothetical protein F5880DRAFT_1511704 [Lentinula raphanica]|nr:hypothetical protein F5880DRAFT_1511704 [Lentinula raphanica]